MEILDASVIMLMPRSIVFGKWDSQSRDFSTVPDIQVVSMNFYQTKT